MFPLTKKGVGRLSLSQHTVLRLEGPKLTDRSRKSSSSIVIQAWTTVFRAVDTPGFRRKMRTYCTLMEDWAGEGFCLWVFVFGSLSCFTISNTFFTTANYLRMPVTLSSVRDSTRHPTNLDRAPNDAPKIFYELPSTAHALPHSRCNIRIRGRWQKYPSG